jgi:hypothetical protein
VWLNYQVLDIAVLHPLPSCDMLPPGW